MIEIRNLKKEYEIVTPLKNVSVTINDGDVISVIGPSGTGKSTFIRCINMLEKPTSGQIIVDGEELTRRFIKGLKVFEVVIDSKDCDFIGFGAELDRYLLKNDVDAAQKYRIRLAIEELVQQILLPVYEQPFIRVNAEYSPGDGACLIDVRYKGRRFDINDTENELSLALLKSTVKDMQYCYHEEEEEPNHVTIRIRH